MKRYDRTPGRKAQSKKRYHKNKKEWLAKRQQRYKNDPTYREKFLNAARARRARFPEQVRASKAAFRAKPQNRLRAAEKSRQWHALNHLYANPRRIMRKQKQRNERPWHIMVNAAKARSKKFKVPFDLTSEWAEARWTGCCELTNLPFTIGLRGASGKLFSPSIDKIIPAAGYTQSNCRFVLHAVNIFKYTGTDEQMYEIAEALLKYREIIRATPQNAPTNQ